MDSDQEKANNGNGDLKLITCVLPDDGVHRKLLSDLHTNRKSVRVSSQSCLGMGVFTDATAKPGTVQDAYLVRHVQIVVNGEEADELFDYIYAAAEIGRPGGGWMMQVPLLAATDYELPAGVPDE